MRPIDMSRYDRNRFWTDNGPRRIQKCASMNRIRLQIVTLRPFIPCLDKDNAVLRIALCNLAYGLLEVGREQFRGLTLINDATHTRPRSIVPAGHDRREIAAALRVVR